MVCAKSVCVCVLCTLELIRVASHRFRVHDETTIRSATRDDDDPVGKLAIRFLSCPGWSVEQPFCHLQCEIQQKVHSAVLSGQQILRFRPRASLTGSSSHREPGIGGWQLELVQAYTIHTHFWHTPSHFALRENVFSCLCPKKGFIVWLKMGMFARNFQQSTVSWVFFRRVGTEGGNWYFVCTANNYEMFFNLLLARINTFFNSFGSSTSWAAWKRTKSEYLLAGKNGRMDFLLDLGVQVTKRLFNASSRTR